MWHTGPDTPRPDTPEPSPPAPTPPSPDPARWPLALRLAHWVMAAAALGTAALALYLLSPPDWSPAYVQRYRDWIDLHKVLGLTALVAAVVLAARHRSRPARSGSVGERRIARIGQATLVILVVVAALAGYLANSLYGNGVTVPGLATIPSPLPRTPDVARVFSQLHGLSAYGLLILTAGHVIAALAHQFTGDDPLLSRMIGTGSRAGRSRGDR